MLLQHNKLLTRHEALEARVPLVSVVGNLRVDSDPLYILRLWEERLHQNLLTTNLELDVAISKFTLRAANSTLLELFDREDGLVYINKLNEGLHCLGSNALHHNMNRLLVLCNSARVATEESKDLLRSDREWDLRKWLAGVKEKVERKNLRC